ncbi:MAG: beta-ketoacyl synthase N-terminal-like domain-containing protein [Geminicoccaceae bacterium]
MPAKGALADADCFDAAFFGLEPARGRPARSAAPPVPRDRLAGAGGCRGHCPSPRASGSASLPGSPRSPGYYHGHLLANAATTAGRRSVPDDALEPAGRRGEPGLLPSRPDRPELALTGTACSTGLVPRPPSRTHLLEGQCDLAVAGPPHSLPLRAGYWHVPGGILSPDGHCRAFAADAAGTVPGNGVAAVVLRRLEDAGRRQSRLCRDPGLCRQQ